MTVILLSTGLILTSQYHLSKMALDVESPPNEIAFMVGVPRPQRLAGLLCRLG